MDPTDCIGMEGTHSAEEILEAVCQGIRYRENEPVCAGHTAVLHSRNLTEVIQVSLADAKTGDGPFDRVKIEIKDRNKPVTFSTEILFQDVFPSQRPALRFYQGPDGAGYQWSSPAPDCIGSLTKAVTAYVEAVL